MQLNSIFSRLIKTIGKPNSVMSHVIATKDFIIASDLDFVAFTKNEGLTPGLYKVIKNTPVLSDPDEYPDFSDWVEPVQTGKNVLSINAYDFHYVLNATSEYATRYPLQYALLQGEFFVATNGRFLNCIRVSLVDETILIPRGLMKLVPKKNIIVDFIEAGEYKAIRVDGVTIVFKNVSLTYPDWTQVIPRYTKNEASLWTNNQDPDFEKVKQKSENVEHPALHFSNTEQPATFDIDNVKKFGLVMPIVANDSKDAKLNIDFLKKAGYVQGYPLIGSGNKRPMIIQLDPVIRIPSGDIAEALGEFF